MTTAVTTTLDAITATAPTHTFHPGAIDWPRATADGEREFLSRVAFGEPGHEDAAVAYIVKELAQLAEIERHVAAVMAIALSELQHDSGPINTGFSLHHALSCFAAEEMQHANTFYRYVREISGWDVKLADNLFDERLDLYRGGDSPYVKLAALCCSAYVGESVITAFEHRTTALDPDRQRFLTELLYLHGLDEARHVQIDHFVFDMVIPELSPGEHTRMRELLAGTEELNRELAARWQALVTSVAGLDYTLGNHAHHTQLEITQKIGERAFGGPVIRPIDEVIDDELRQLIERFTDRATIHR